VQFGQWESIDVTDGSDQSQSTGRGNAVRVRRLGIDTHQEPIVYMRKDSAVCRAEGFEAQTRVEVKTATNTIIATLNVVDGELQSNGFVEKGEAGLSEAAWRRLGARDGENARIRHAPPVDSLGYVRAKIYGHRLSTANFRAILDDIVDGEYADVHLAAFLTACGGDRIDDEEVAGLTVAMRDVGEQLDWERHPVVDKHCVGGLPGNRTTPIVVSIIAEYGLTIPKTSSRAITSPAGTADTMQVLAPVNLSLRDIKRVVERENGCVAWGGAVRLSPADDALIRVERALDLDSEGQLVASVLSKKAAAGSTHVVIDIPVGPTAKVRSERAADKLEALFEVAAESVGLKLSIVRTDGRQPVGRGIGPALEARDVLAVLKGEAEAPTDLADRSILLAGEIIALAEDVGAEEGRTRARRILESGGGWDRFQRICRAQGGMRQPPSSSFQNDVEARRGGVVAEVDNRQIARLAKLAGAPEAPAAGLEMHVRLGEQVEAGDRLMTIHCETPGERDYARQYLKEHRETLIRVEDEKP
jgi:thymidine phosphorylase